MPEEKKVEITGWKLNTKRVFLVGLAFLMISMFWGLYDQTMKIILRNRFGLDHAFSGIVLGLDNFLALIFLPLFGTWSDKTKSRIGKRKIYILIGTVCAAILLVGLAIIDVWQFNTVDAHQITQVFEIDGGFNFKIADVLQDADLNTAGIQHFASSDLAENARAAYIFKNITQPNWHIFTIFMVVLFFLLMAMCSYRSPAVALMPDVTIKPLRSKANAIINAMGTIGGTITIIAGIVLGRINFVNDNPLHYIPLFALIAGLMFVFLALFMYFVKENKWAKEMEEESFKYGIETREDVELIKQDKTIKMPKDVQRSFILILLSVVLWFFAYNAASSAIASYANEVLRIQNTFAVTAIGFVAALIAFYPVAIVSQKIGRRRTILIGISIMFVGFIFATLSGALEQIWLLYLAMALIGVGWATINVNSYPMVVEMSHGPNIGKYTGYYYSASMFAQILTPFISGLFMDQFGTNVLFYYCLFFTLLAFIPMFFVRHGEPKRLEDVKGIIEVETSQE
ncbi:MAG: MFS transporter [Bacilli bacterium]|jgi:maltose/moltooligosaccharide transporter